MTDVIWIAVIGALCWIATMVGSFYIEKRTTDFVVFMYIMVLSLVVFPLILIKVIQ